jgi:hypothetical protein
VRVAQTTQSVTGSGCFLAKKPRKPSSSAVSDTVSPVGETQATRRPYQHNPVHRDGTPGKTQWKTDVTISDEEAIFRLGEDSGWMEGSNVFSLRIGASSAIDYLDAEDFLNFAHFSGAAVWHGWPANPKRSPKDMPSYEILRAWVERKFTTRARVAKLMRYQRCAI